MGERAECGVVAQVSGVSGSSLIVNVPGSQNAAVESVTLLLPIPVTRSRLRSEIM